MKILHLHTELNLACGITRTISQIVHNSPIDFEHHLISLGGNALSRFENKKIRLKVVSINRYSLSGTIKIFFVLLNYCRNNSIQIVHSHHRYFDALVWYLKPFIKIKTVTSVQSKVYGKKVFSYKAGKLIACSKTIKNHLINIFNIDENRIEVIYNSVDAASSVHLIEKERLKNQIGIGLEEFVIGFVGRLDFAEKGIDVLLETIMELFSLQLRIHLLLIGDGPNYLEVEKFCKMNKNKTTLLTSKENIFDYYNLMNMVVLPSRIDPFPLTMIETGLMNKPFVGSNLDGIDELIEHEKDGLLFESGNADDLKNQILRIFKDKKLADYLSENLNKKVLESYTLEKIIPQYEEVYLDVIRKL